MDRLNKRYKNFLYQKEVEFKLQEHFSPKELGNLMKVSAKTIKRLVYKHHLKIHFVGRQMRIPKSEAVKLLESAYEESSFERSS